MKNPLFALGLALLINDARGDWIKWADGQLTEASNWKLSPRLVELVTDNGTEVVEPSKLRLEWIKSKFPDQKAIILKYQLDQLSKAIQDSFGGPSPIPGPSLELQREELIFRIKDLKEQNLKLKAELRKLRGP